MLKVYTVYDKAVGSFMPPFYCKADGEAIRSFMDAVNQSDSPFFKHPGDFELYALGDFDQGSGLYECGSPRRIISASEVAAKVA